MPRGGITYDNYVDNHFKPVIKAAVDGTLATGQNILRALSREKNATFCARRAWNGIHALFIKASSIRDTPGVYLSAVR